jgi:condensin complex subunit 1
MVITHLILNDMLKLKGEIVDICMLLEDDEEKIRDQVKLFLHELHTKANHMIYNLFPKAISRLSKEFGHLSREKFENIARNLLTHIDKDRQTEQLVDKLCHKLRNSPLPVEWRNTAYCLSQMKYTERIFQRLVDYYETSYKERLSESPEVREYFLIIVQQVKKFTKPEVKKQVDDFELKITSAGQQILINDKNPFQAVVGARKSALEGAAEDEIRKSNSMQASTSTTKKRKGHEITSEQLEEQQQQLIRHSATSANDLQRNIAQAKRSSNPPGMQQA